jgi:hypothetical protein
MLLPQQMCCLVNLQCSSLLRSVVTLETKWKNWRKCFAGNDCHFCRYFYPLFLLGNVFWQMFYIQPVSLWRTVFRVFLSEICCCSSEGQEKYVRELPWGTSRELWKITPMPLHAVSQELMRYFRGTGMIFPRLAFTLDVIWGHTSYMAYGALFCNWNWIKWPRRVFFAGAPQFF